MKRLLLASFFFTLATLLFSTAPAQAAQGGNRANRGDPVTFILSHSKDLNITAEQKTQLETIQKDSREARKNAAGGDRTEFAAKMKETNEKVTAVLTKEQQEKLTALKEKAAPDKKAP